MKAVNHPAALPVRPACRTPQPIAQPIAPCQQAARDQPRKVRAFLAYRLPLRLYAALATVCVHLLLQGILHMGRPATHRQQSTIMSDCYKHHVRSILACQLSRP